VREMAETVHTQARTDVWNDQRILDQPNCKGHWLRLGILIGLPSTRLRMVHRKANRMWSPVTRTASSRFGSSGIVVGNDRGFVWRMAAGADIAIERAGPMARYGYRADRTPPRLVGSMVDCD